MSLFWLHKVLISPLFNKHVGSHMKSTLALGLFLRTLPRSFLTVRLGTDIHTVRPSRFLILTITRIWHKNMRCSLFFSCSNISQTIFYFLVSFFFNYNEIQLLAHLNQHKYECWDDNIPMYQTSRLLSHFFILSWLRLYCCDIEESINCPFT